MAGEVLRPIVIVWPKGIARIVHVPHADVLVVRAQDVCAMAGAVHPGCYDLLRRRVAGCDILAARPNRRISCRQHTAACRRAVRTRVAEEIVIGHVLAVAECGSIQGRVTHQRRQPRLSPLLIRERDHLLRECGQRRSVWAGAATAALQNRRAAARETFGTRLGCHSVRKQHDNHREAYQQPAREKGLA